MKFACQCDIIQYNSRHVSREAHHKNIWKACRLVCLPHTSGCDHWRNCEWQRNHNTNNKKTGAAQLRMDCSGLGTWNCRKDPMCDCVIRRTATGNKPIKETQLSPGAISRPQDYNHPFLPLSSTPCHAQTTASLWKSWTIEAGFLYPASIHTDIFFLYNILRLVQFCGSLERKRGVEFS